MLHLSSEMRFLESEGFKCTLMGDFNAHVGNGIQGVPGNRKEVNANGRLVQSFVENNELVMINAQRQLCSGIFTRMGHNSATLLDYAFTFFSIQYVKQIEKRTELTVWETRRTGNQDL